MNRNPEYLKWWKARTGWAGVSVLAVGMLGGIMSARILPLNIKVGDKAPDFELLSADGKTVRLSEFAGHNVLIDFYRAHW